VAWALVGDVAYVIGIDTLRSAKLVIDGSSKAKPSLDRILGLRPGLIELSPAKLLPSTAHHVPLSSHAIAP